MNLQKKMKVGYKQFTKLPGNITFTIAVRLARRHHGRIRCEAVLLIRTLRHLTVGI